jgi:hypothetical protein
MIAQYGETVLCSSVEFKAKLKVLYYFMNNVAVLKRLCCLEKANSALPPLETFSTFFLSMFLYCEIDWEV